MSVYYAAVKSLHFVTVAVTITLFVLRFFWLKSGSAMMQRRWVRILPHVNDSLLFITGIALAIMGHVYPFSSQNVWLTEKLFAVIIYIVLGVITLGGRNRASRLRWTAFLAALVVLYVIIKLAILKMPLLGIV